MLIGGCLAFWAFLGPVPYEVVIGLLIALPWVAIAAAKLSGGHVLMAQDDDASGLPGLFSLALFPSIALVGRVASDFPLVNAWPAGVVMASIGLVIVLAALFMPRSRSGETVRSQNARRRPFDGWLWKLVMLLPLVLAYAYGVAVFANGYGDTRIVQTYRVAIVGKSMHSGKGSHYLLELAPWPLGNSTGNEPVPSEIYAAVKPGDDICFDEHAGRFGWHWTRLHLCGQSSSATAPVSS